MGWDIYMYCDEWYCCCLVEAVSIEYRAVSTCGVYLLWGTRWFCLSLSISTYLDKFVYKHLLGKKIREVKCIELYP